MLDEGWGGWMSTEITTQLITVGATLGGVLLTLTANAYLEVRRARDARERESLRIAEERAVWLRDAKMAAYSALSLAGEEVQQFVRWELPLLLGPHGNKRQEAIENHWTGLHAGLRKAYNEVALLGAEQPRVVGREVWRLARYGCNDFLRDLTSTRARSRDQADLAERLSEVASTIGTAGEQFLEACREDLLG
jgi:hypothetical protein